LRRQVIADASQHREKQQRYNQEAWLVIPPQVRDEATSFFERCAAAPVAKGLAIVGLFAFVGLLYAGRWMGAVSSLVAAVILGLLANIVTAIFQGSNAASFTLGG
jgi:hypothetical protein